MTDKHLGILEALFQAIGKLHFEAVMSEDSFKEQGDLVQALICKTRIEAYSNAMNLIEEAKKQV